MKICADTSCALAPLCAYKVKFTGIHKQTFYPIHTGEFCDVYVPKSELNDAYAIPEEQDE